MRDRGRGGKGGGKGGRVRWGRGGGVREGTRKEKDVDGADARSRLTKKRGECVANSSIAPRNHKC